MNKTYLVESLLEFDEEAAFNLPDKDPNLLDKKGNRPIDYAVRNGNVEIVNLLTQKDKLILVDDNDQEKEKDLWKEHLDIILIVFMMIIMNTMIN